MEHLRIIRGCFRRSCTVFQVSRPFFLVPILNMSDNDVCIEMFLLNDFVTKCMLALLFCPLMMVFTCTETGLENDKCNNLYPTSFYSPSKTRKRYTV